MSHPETSSGGGPSASGGYSSKLEWSSGSATWGDIGGFSVRLIRPSQLNPSNHLEEGEGYFRAPRGGRGWESAGETHLCFCISLMPPFW